MQQDNPKRIEELTGFITGNHNINNIDVTVFRLKKGS